MDDAVQTSAKRPESSALRIDRRRRGIGKTTVAIAVAHEVLSELTEQFSFLIQVAIENPQLVGGALHHSSDSP